MSPRAWSSVCLGVLVLLGALFLPKVFLAESALYTDGALGPRVLLTVGSLSKLIFLGLSTYFSGSCLRAYERGNPVRPAWWLLTLGLGAYFLGQASLGYYQLLLGTDAPFPSVADCFFIASMVALLASLVLFVNAYRQVGYLGEASTAWATAGATAVVATAILVVLIRPIIDHPAPLLEQLLNVAYPVLDGLLLIPALVLLQAAARMRGGRLWQVWALLLLGFCFVAAGDILFAYFTTLEMTVFNPLLNLLFAYAYVLIAWGVYEQRQIVAV